MLKFTKMNGAGNDFVVLDNLDSRLALGSGEIARERQHRPTLHAEVRVVGRARRPLFRGTPRPSPSPAICWDPPSSPRAWWRWPSSTSRAGPRRRRRTRSRSTPSR